MSFVKGDTVKYRNSHSTFIKGFIIGEKYHERQIKISGISEAFSTCELLQITKIPRTFIHDYSEFIFQTRMVLTEKYIKEFDLRFE